jgi:hypothetical protein
MIVEPGFGKTKAGFCFSTFPQTICKLGVFGAFVAERRLNRAPQLHKLIFESMRK